MNNIGHLTADEEAAIKRSIEFLGGNLRFSSLFTCINYILAERERTARHLGGRQALREARAKVYNGAPDENGFHFQSFYNEGVAPWLEDMIFRLENECGEVQHREYGSPACRLLRGHSEDCVYE